MDEFTEMTLLDAYLDALSRDPNAPIPEGLDPDFARFVRTMATNRGAQRISEVQARVWHKALRDAQAVRAEQRKPTPTVVRLRYQPSLKPSSISLLAAVLAVAIVSVIFIRSITSKNQPTPTSIPAAARSVPAEVFATVPASTATLSAASPTVTSSPDYAVVGKGVIHAITWSADRSQLVVASTSGIWLYRANGLDSDGIHLNGYDGAMDIAVFSPDGTTLASANANAVVLWDIAHAQATAMLHVDSVNALAFSPDGKLLAGAGVSNVIWLWDIANGKQIAALNTLTVISSLAFSPDGTLLASGGSDGLIRLWNMTTLTQESTLQPPDGTPLDRVTALLFSPDGTILASGSKANWVRIWDVKTQTLQHSRTDVLQGVLSLSFSLDSNAVAYTDGDTAWLWQFKTNIDPAFLDKATHWQSVVYALNGSPLALGYNASGWRQWNAFPDPNLLRGFTSNP
jgi:WD40 repeat protein